ncbi:hypothetical protein ACK389_22050 [Streptomyces antibioticus]|uniref:hypothetical protein n=1 Tax=Streptomyces antibioticus TaxID=1890 RepID=UPI0033C5A3C6
MPAVEAVVDWAYRQWRRIGDAARASELWPVPVELRRALDHVQVQVRPGVGRATW